MHSAAHKWLLEDKYGYLSSAATVVCIRVHTYSTIMRTYQPTNVALLFTQYLQENNKAKVVPSKRKIGPYPGFMNVVVVVVHLGLSICCCFYVGFDQIPKAWPWNRKLISTVAIIIILYSIKSRAANLISIPQYYTVALSAHRTYTVDTRTSDVQAEITQAKDSRLKRAVGRNIKKLHGPYTFYSCLNFKTPSHLVQVVLAIVCLSIHVCL